MKLFDPLRNRKHTLKSRIAISVTLLFILFSTIIGVVGKGYFEKKTKESIFSEQSSLVSALASTIDDKINLIHQALIAEAGQTGADVAADPAKAQHYLDSRLALKSLFKNALFLFDKDGKIIAESPYLEGRRGRDISFRDFFITTMATGKPHISSPYISTHNPDHPAVILTAPIFDKNGAVVNVLAGSFDLLGTNILGDLSATRVGKTGYIYIFATDRTMIMHPDRTRIMKQDVLPGSNLLYDRAIAGFEGSGETVNSRGLRVLASFKRLKSTGWILAANFPVAEAYAPLIEARNLYALLLVAGTLFMILLIWVMMQRYLIPLGTITRYVFALPEHIADRTPLRITSGDEIETLADAFNTMLDEVALQQLTLQESKNNFKAIAENANDGFMVIDHRGRFLYANRQASQITDYTVDELTTMTVRDLVVTNGMEELRSQYRNNAGASVYETVIAGKDGQPIPVEVSTAETLWKGRRAELVIFRDVSDRHYAELSLRISEERYRMLVENQSDLIVKTDQAGNFLFVSPSLCEFVGKEEAELLGSSFNDLVHEDDRIPVQEARKEIHFPPYACRYEHRIDVDGEINWLAWSEKAVQTDDGIAAIVAVGRNVTRRKSDEEEIRRLAYYDVLTNLPNRALLRDRFRQAIAQAIRDKRHVGLLFLDLDRFKSINDTMGHSMGDRLLCTVAQRLGQSIRETDTLARLGGDEFVIALTAVSHADDFSIAATKILAAISAPLNLGGTELYTSVSIGIAIFPEDGNDVDTLLKHADLAMYKAKEIGRNNFQYFSHDMNVKASERLMLENCLRKAVDRGELYLVYQPQVNLHTGTLVGVEALLRWQHPELGLVPPARFIPLAEETGLIGPIGKWVFENSCRQAMKWHTAGLPAIRIAVNISARQFAQDDFLESVLATIADSGLPANWLEIELTESAIMTDVKRTAKILRELKNAGISISIDDFGTGYSSLGYLKQFPLDRLKIDRSFVCRVHEDSNDAAIAEAIIKMSHALGLLVIAEGIELQEQLLFLAELGCDEIQGYLLSKPLSADEAGRFMEGCRSIE